MARTTEVWATTDTDKVRNTRVEIDTSPPFESVKQAVDRFGGSGPWIPLHLLRLPAAGHHETTDVDLERREEHAMQLERDLTVKERETLSVLKELEATKKFVECLKANLTPAFMVSSDLQMGSNRTVNDENSTEGLRLCPVLSPRLMFMELNHAKINLNKTSGDLAVIQASVESLNNKMGSNNLSLEWTKMKIPHSAEVLILEQNHQIQDGHRKLGMAEGTDISISMRGELKQVSFEAQQIKKMTEASRCEVIKAIAEIERTKHSIRMAEMRLNAAKKMEEAAKVLEFIAQAERKALSKGKYSSEVFLHKPAGITLSFEEYRTLTQRAQQAEDMCKTKFVDTNAIQKMNDDHHLDVPILEKFEENAIKNTQSREVNLFNEDGCHRTNIIEEDYDSRASVTHCLSQQSEKKFTDYKFRNSHPSDRNPSVFHGNESNAMKEKSMPGFRTATSIGDILSRKLILQDDVMVGKHVENSSERQHISLSQRLREQSRLILHSPKPTANTNVEKQYFFRKKKFGFIQVPLRSKESKKKMQPLNMR